MRKVCLCNHEDLVRLSPAPPFPAPGSAISLPPLDCLRFFQAAGRRGRRRSAPGRAQGRARSGSQCFPQGRYRPAHPRGRGSRSGGDGPELPNRFRLDGDERLNAAPTVEAMGGSGRLERTDVAGRPGRTLRGRNRVRSADRRRTIEACAALRGGPRVSGKRRVRDRIPIRFARPAHPGRGRMRIRRLRGHPGRGAVARHDGRRISSASMPAASLQYLNLRHMPIGSSRKAVATEASAARRLPCGSSYRASQRCTLA